MASSVSNWKPIVFGGPASSGPPRVSSGLSTPVQSGQGGGMVKKRRAPITRMVGSGGLKGPSTGSLSTLSKIGGFRANFGNGTRIRGGTTIQSNYGFRPNA